MTSTLKRPAINAINWIVSRHWAMEEESIHTMLSIAARENPDVEAVAARLGRPLDNTRQVTLRDGIATIPVAGPLFRYADFFTEISGATTYEQLATDFTAALDNAMVRAIVLAIDSPGGDANGVSQLAALFASARGVKPVVAFVGGTGASAAYWLASAADIVITSDTGILGSIGVRMAYRDTSAADQAKGVKTIELISSQSPNKRMDPTEDVGRAALQRVVDDLAAVFVESVATYRGVSPETVLAEFGQGGVFVGRAAVDAGLADTVGTYESTVAALRERGAEAVAEWRGESSAARPAASSPLSTPPMTTKKNIPGAAAKGGAKADAGAETCPECGGPMQDGVCQDCGYTAEDTSPDEQDDTQKQDKAAKAGAEVIDLAQVRADERQRIAAIQALGKGADPKLVEQCINDGVSVDAAGRAFLEAQQQSAAAQLDKLRADEKQSPSPNAGATTTEPANAREAGRAAARAFYQLTAPPSKSV